VEVLFRRSHERAGWCSRRRREGDGEKRRAEKTGLENEAAHTKNQPIYFSSNASKSTWNEVKPFSSAATAELIGVRFATGGMSVSGAVGMKDARQLAR